MFVMVVRVCSWVGYGLCRERRVVFHPLGRASFLKGWRVKDVTSVGPADVGYVGMEESRGTLKKTVSAFVELGVSAYVVPHGAQKKVRNGDVAEIWRLLRQFQNRVATCFRLQGSISQRIFVDCLVRLCVSKDGCYV